MEREKNSDLGSDQDPEFAHDMDPKIRIWIHNKLILMGCRWTVPFSRIWSEILNKRNNKNDFWCLFIRFLISRCLSSPMLTHSLYWHLTQCLPGVSPQVGTPPPSQVFMLYLGWTFSVICYYLRIKFTNYKLKGVY